MIYNLAVLRPFGLFALWIAISLFSRALFIPIEILDMDEAAHAVGSWTWMDGGSLYQDFINNKPPMLYVYYSLAQLFERSIPAVHLLTAIMVVPLTALAASAFFDYDKRGFFAGLVYLVYSASFLAHDMHSTNAEILMVLPGAWAVVLLRNEELTRSGYRNLVSGILFGIGFLFKYQIALGIFAITIASLAQNRRNFRFLFLFAGFLIPVVCTLILFYATGGLDALLYWLFWNNLKYTSNPISWFEAAGRAASYLLPFLILTTPLWWFAFRSRHLLDPYRRVMIIALLLISIPPIFVGFRFYPHYFIQLYFPLSIAAAPVVADLVLNRPKCAKIFFSYSICLFLLCTAGNAYLYYSHSTIYREKDPVYSRVAERLIRDECFTGGSLFVWGYAPAFYYYARLQPASRFVVMGQARLTGYVSGNLGSLNQPSQQGVPEHWDWLMADLQRKQATYILDTAPAAIYRWDRFPMQNFTRLKSYVDQNFDQLDNIDGVVIYRRRGCAQ